MDSSSADLSLVFIKKFDHFLPMLFNNRALIYRMFFHRIHRILRYQKKLNFNFEETLSTVIIYSFQRTLR